MRRPPARRSRRLAVALTAVAAAACGGGDDHTITVVDVVNVAAQPCDRPTRSLGMGVVVAENVVATAGHTVEGSLRELRVDDRPASVLALDVRTDLALLSADTTAQPLSLSSSAPPTATVITPDGDLAVRVERTGPLVVHDTTERMRYERQVHVFSPGVAEGTSGAPIVDAAGRLLGIVVLDNPSEGVAYAVTSSELAALLAAPRSSAPSGCPD